MIEYDLIKYEESRIDHRHYGQKVVLSKKEMVKLFGTDDIFNDFFYKYISNLDRYKRPLIISIPKNMDENKVTQEFWNSNFSESLLKIWNADDKIQKRSIGTFMFFMNDEQMKQHDKTHKIYGIEISKHQFNKWKNETKEEE